MKKLVLGIALLAIQASAWACVYNGSAYPVGTVIGPYVCTPNGWTNR